MSNEVKIEVSNFDSIVNPFERLSKGLDFRAVGGFEKLLFVMFADTQAKVHVETGVLKASGTKRSNNDADKWTGEIEYLRHPGVFELARGNSPTLFHPEGGHDFFSGLPALAESLEEHIDEVFKDAFDRNAPL